MKKATIEVQGFEENVQRSKSLSNGVMERPILVRDVSPWNNVQTTDQSAMVLSEVTSEKGPTATVATPGIFLRMFLKKYKLRNL